MKKLLLFLVLLLPLVSYAAYPVADTAVLVRTSSEDFSVAGTGTGLGVTSAFTFEGWYKLTTLGTNSQLFLHNAAGTGGFIVVMQTNNTILCRYWNAGQASNEDITTNSEVFTNTTTWHHIACVVNGTAGKILVDGVATTTTTSGSVTPGADTGTIHIGGNNGFWAGKIGLVRYWTTNRSDAQILANMCTVLGATTNLGAEWTLNNTTADNTGNGNTLTANNSPTFGTDVPGTPPCPTVAAATQPLLGHGGFIN